MDRFFEQLIELINAIHYIRSKKFWTLATLIVVSVSGVSARPVKKPDSQKIRYLKQQTANLAGINESVEEPLKSIIAAHLENISYLLETGKIPPAQIQDGIEQTDDIYIYVPRDGE